MKRIRFWVVFALLLAVSALFVLSASAEDRIEGGECGEDVHWSLDLNTGELVIYGEGDMKDYGGSGGSTPWYGYRNSIRSVTVWEGVTSLGNYAFYNCINLTEVALPEGITEIPPSAFAGCSKLNELEIPDTVTSIGSAAFRRCSSLSHITLPEGLESIGSNAFDNCATLTEITLPVGVTTIGEQAFAGCNRLATVSLPNTLTHVGSSVFTGTALTKVLFYGTQEEWEALSLGTGNTLLTNTLIIHPDHVFDREITDYEYLKSGADCENPEIYYKSCACGESGEETFTHGEPMGHTGGTATCLERAVCLICWEPYGELGEHTPDGEPSCLSDVHCTVCEELLTAALGHEYGEEIVPPTCTEQGYTLHACVRGDDSYTDTFVDATGHTEGAPATCTEDQTCTACGEVLSEALEHDHRSTVTLPATCTEPGVMTAACTRCEDTFTRAIPPNGHTPGSEATCTEAQLCTVCHQQLTEKLGHNYGSVTVDPTCTDRGYELHTCSRCQISYLDTFVPAKGHTPGVAASCTEPQTCTVCSAVLAQAQEHTYQETEVEATCLEQGYILHTCTHCSHSYVGDTVPALGHRGDIGAATCIDPVICVRCNTVMAERLGHEYQDLEVPPTCILEGYTRHRCTRCSLIYDDAIVAPLGHTAGDWITDRSPSFGEAGRRHTECTACGSLLERETFSDESEAPTEPDSGETDTLPATSAAAETDEEADTGGCGQTIGNILVISIVLVAVFLFWFIDSKRRHR